MYNALKQIDFYLIIHLEFKSILVRPGGPHFFRDLQGGGLVPHISSLSFFAGLPALSCRRCSLAATEHGRASTVRAGLSFPEPPGPPFLIGLFLRGRKL
jgi:hypothetical protein